MAAAEQGREPYGSVVVTRAERKGAPRTASLVASCLVCRVAFFRVARARARTLPIRQARGAGSTDARKYRALALA
jgi:hypothetical protein